MSAAICQVIRLEQHQKTMKTLSESPRAAPTKHKVVFFSCGVATGAFENTVFVFVFPIFQNFACVFFFAGGRAPDLAVLRANPAKEHAKIRQSRPFVTHFSAPHLADATFSCGVPIGFF